MPIKSHLVCESCNDHCYQASFDTIGRPYVVDRPNYEKIISNPDETFATRLISCDWWQMFYACPEDKIAICSDIYCPDCYE